MENKAKIGFLILLIFYIILAESEMWGPVIITGDTPAEAILKLSNTPAAVSAESVLVKRYDSTISSYPINNIKTTKIQWDSVTSKPTAYNPVLHQHDSIYYRETEVNNLLSSKSDTSHTHPQSKINGLVDTITNHRNAIASKFATADTNKLARKSHNHNISDVNNLSTELSNRYTKTELQTSGFSQVHWGNITNKPSTFTPSAHTLVSHSDWSTYFDQALKTTSTPTFAKINISNGGLINDWVHLGATHNPSSPYEKRWYKAYELTGTGRGDEDIELRVHGDVNYYNGACIVRLKITRYDGEPANQLHVTITPISGWPSNALVKVDGGIVWVASNFKWGDIYGRLVQSRYNPGRVLFNTAYTQTEPAGVSINGTFGVKTYDGDTQNVVLHDVEGANGYFTGNVTVNGYGVWHSGNFDPSTKANATHGHAWGEITDKPSTFAPSAHVHAIADVTSLQTALDSKQPLDSDLTAIAGLTHSNRHVMVSNGSSWTRRALAEDDLPSLSISKITGLQTALDSKEPAITGIANKVLSIQAGGSGVKTGSIYDDGNVVQFEKAFIGNSSSTGIRHYHDLYLYNNLNSTDTGILKIVMPQGWTNTFQRITIKGYNYISGQGAWECIIGGYNYNATNDANDQWVNYSAQIRGSAPFSTVRLGYDGSKCVLLLGTTETVWSYAKVAISDMLVGGVGSAIYNWETGWSASIITSETGLTKIVAPTVNSGVGADWNALINKPSYFAPSAHTHPWSEVTGKPSTFAPSAHTHPWSEITGKPSTFTPSAHNHGTGTTNYIPLFTNGATGTIGNSQLSQNTDGVIASKGITANDFLQSMGPLYTRSHVYLINKAGTGWLSFVTRDVSGSEAKFNLANIGSIDGVGPITLSDGVGGYFQLYNNSGQGRAMLKTNNKMYFTVETSTLPAADAITIDRDAGSLGDGIPKVDINAVTLMNEDLHIQGDVNVNSLVRLSGAVRYDYIQHVGSVPTIDTDNYPGIYLIPSNPHNYTLTGGAPEQRIFVGNRSTHVQQVEGYRIEPGQFRDFLKTGTGWIASGASISGKTISVSHGTGNISVSNVSTVHINYTPTSTYTLTDGYVGQRVTVVVLSGSAQHWIHGATKGHKIVEGEFRDFIYTTDGWVASAADY